LLLRRTKMRKALTGILALAEGLHGAVSLVDAGGTQTTCAEAREEARYSSAVEGVRVHLGPELEHPGAVDAQCGLGTTADLLAE
jgi:hypothetical protein